MSLRRPPLRTYSITQLSREFGATPRALRYYEEQGLLAPARQSLQRIYSYKDRARLQLILRGRRVGLSLVDIRAILDAYELGGEAAQNVCALAIFRARIAALEAERREVDAAIAALTAAAERLSRQFPDVRLEPRSHTQTTPDCASVYLPSA